MDYLQENLKGFEGDTFAAEKISQLVVENNIQTIIETGTYLGSTTLRFAEMAKQVFTIESNVGFRNQAKPKFDGKNIRSLMGSSTEVLPLVLEIAHGKQGVEGPLFFFLDAHWEANNPLLEELAIIADGVKKEIILKPIIAIHDFKVPDHPELGFDTYGGQDYDWAWIEKSVEAIYGAGGYTVEYNSEATGLKRGIIYIKPA